MITTNLCLKRTKCEFLQKEVEFLSHTVSAAGLQPNSKKVEVVKQHPVPKDRSELKSYLGICNYYRKFIEGFAKIAHPLHDLLKKDVPYIWSPACQEAFETLKNKLVSSPVLGLADFSVEFSL